MSEIKAVKMEGETLKIRGMASTKDVDRAGDIMDPECWTKGGLTNYEKNPILLFNHDYNRPVGKTTSLKVTDSGLEIEAEISGADPKIKALIEMGVLKTFSVGFGIKDADYMRESGGLHIKDVELYEVSVVSVPCNQDAVFDVVKSYTAAEYKKHINALPEPEVETVSEDTTRTNNMDKEEIEKMIKEIMAKGLAFAEAERQAKEKAKAEADAKAKAEAEAKAAAEKIEKELAEVKASVGEDRTEALIEKVKAALEAENKTEFEALKSEIAEYKDEIKSLTANKRRFVTDGAKDWKEASEADLRDAYVLGAVLEKGWNTKFGAATIEKVNALSGLAVAATTAEVYETVVSTSIERDIQHALVIAPMFREIMMNAASMILPIMPDAGYAEFISTKTLTNTGFDAPHGNLSERGDTEGSPYGGFDLGTKTLTTKKLMSLSYLANETEEDAIMPILPLINEAMVRSHARAVERSILRGSNSIGSYDGLATIAATNSKVLTSPTAFNSDALTSDNLLEMRKNMGKYGVRPGDVVYIVSERGYFELLEDPEYKDASLVGASAATKLTGEVGRIYGSPVVLCDEFEAPAVGKVHALAVNTRNFLRPRLRGLTLESQYQAKYQHRELIATQRIGFEELIEGAAAVVGRKYAAA